MLPAVNIGPTQRRVACRTTLHHLHHLCWHDLISVAQFSIHQRERPITSALGVTGEKKLKHHGVLKPV